jgi:hypothetical protein
VPCRRHTLLPSLSGIRWRNSKGVKKDACVSCRFAHIFTFCIGHGLAGQQDEGRAITISHSHLHGVNTG